MLVNRRIVGTVSPILGLPSNLSEFTWSYGNLVNFSAMFVCGPDQEIHYSRPAHSFHSIARNALAANSMGNWHLMLDTDHSFAPDLLFRLLNAMNKFNAEVVSGLYLHRSPPFTPTLWNFLKGRDHGHIFLADWPQDEVLKVDCAGAGCLLVKTSVYKRIWDELGEEPFSTTEYSQGGATTGEDFAFFRRCQKLGVRTICPTYIQCHHLQIRPLDYEKDYDAVGAIEERMAIGG